MSEKGLSNVSCHLHIKETLEQDPQNIVIYPFLSTTNIDFGT